MLILLPWFTWMATHHPIQFCRDTPLTLQEYTLVLQVKLYQQTNAIMVVYAIPCCTLRFKYSFSCNLSRDCHVAGNRYSWLLFTSEVRLCANLRVQEQATNMTSQCQYLPFAWRQIELGWRHKPNRLNSEKTVYGGNGEMSNDCFSGLCAPSGVN